MSNPWLVDNFDDFWFLNCPECAFKTKTQNGFQKHAVVNHTLSSVLFSGDSDILKVATIKEEIGTEHGNFKKLKLLDIKVEPDDYLMTDDPTLEEIMYPDFEGVAPDMSSIESTKKSFINRNKASRKLKREAKIKLKNLIVKQCTEDFISPARLAAIHKLNVCTIRQWVKHSGEKLPIKYDLKKISNKKLISTESSIEEDSFSSNDIDMEKEFQAENYKDSFLCPKCDHKSPSKYHLDMHLEGHCDCSVCGMTFFGGNGVRNLARHLKKHEIKAKKQFICDFCNFEYKTKQTLQRHQNTCKKNVQKDQEHQEKYDESFEVDNKSDNDEIIVDPVFETSDAFLCPKCDHKSPSKYHLDLHIEGHHDCSECGMTFFGGNGVRDLANHMKKHFKQIKQIIAKKEFLCEFCNFVYKSKRNLLRHQTTCKKNVKQEPFEEEFPNEEYEDYGEEDVEGDVDQEFAQNTEEGIYGEGKYQDEVVDGEVQYESPSTIMPGLAKPGGRGPFSDISSKICSDA